MKLHLPKMLLTAVLAAIVMPTTWADDETHWDITSGDYTDTATTISNGTTFYLGNGTSDGNGTGDGSTVFTSGKFTIENGGTLHLHGWTGSERTMNTSGKLQIASDIEIQGGGKLQLQDGSYYFSKNVNITGTAENSSVMFSTYDKGFVFDNLTGAETAVLELQNGGWSPNTFTLQGNGAYAGSIKLGLRAGQRMYLAINSAQALASTASVHLANSSSSLALNTASLTLSSISSDGGSIILAKNATDSIIGAATPVESATLTISNNGSTTDAFIGTIGAGVTLELAAGSSQTFGQITNNGTITVNETAKYNLLSVHEFNYAGAEMTLEDADGSTTSGNGFATAWNISLFTEGSTGSSNLSTVYYNGTAYTVTDGKVNVSDVSYDTYYIGGTANTDTVNAAKEAATAKGATLQIVEVQSGGTLDGLNHSSGELTVKGTISNEVNVTGGVLTVVSNGALTGENVNITNGELKVSYSGDGGSAISHSTTVNVGAGGTLRLDGHDSLGWSANAAPKLIKLTGGDENSLATMHINDAGGTTTWCAPISMNGHSKISGTSINILGNPTLTVAQTNNVIDINEIKVRSNFNINVGENGALEIKSLLSHYTAPENNPTNEKLIKSGAGTLILSHADATYASGTEIQGGTIVVKAGKALGTGAVTISDGGTLDLEQIQAAYGVGNINMNDGSTLIVRNGYYGNSFDSAINVAGNVNLQSGWGGNSGVIASNINGQGSMSMSNLIWGDNPTSDAWKISGVISDKAETEKLSVINVSGVATLSGANTYSGGTTIKGGTVTTANASALGTGKVTMEGGTLMMAEARTENDTEIPGDLTVSAMDYTGGTVNNNGQKLTVTGKLTAAANMSIEGDGDTELGSLDLSAGTTLSVAGSLTIGELILNLENYTDYTRTYDLVTVTGEGKNVTLSNACTGSVDGYTYTVDGSGTNTLTLNFKAPAQSDSLTTTVLDATLDGTMLTLNVDGDITDVTRTANITGFADGVLEKILNLTKGVEDGIVGITLIDTDDLTDDDIVGNGTDNVGFYGAYYGEGAGVGYQVAYIPEPATATLSLLALAGLAARRRRKH